MHCSFVVGGEGITPAEADTADIAIIAAMSAATVTNETMRLTV